MQRFPCFFVIGLPSCFVLPCLATECHAFGLKIATAAMRPRNDTKVERFYLENERFCFRRPFSRGITPLKFETFRSETVPFFPQNPSSLSLRGGRVRPTRQSLTKQIGIPKRNMENRNETGRNNTRRHNSPRVSYYVDHFSLSVPVLRHGMPCLRLKDCHVAALLVMTQNWNDFIWKTNVFVLGGLFARYRSTKI